MLCEIETIANAWPLDRSAKPRRRFHQEVSSSEEKDYGLPSVSQYVQGFSRC